MNAWLAEQAAAWDALRGARVARWTGVEYAIAESPTDVFHFGGAGLPFQQLLELGLELDSGRKLVIRAYDPDQGLAAPEERQTVEPHGTIARTADLHRLRRGRIDDIELRVGADHYGSPVLAEVVLVLADARILIVAAEVDGDRCSWLDESLLVFPDDRDADTVAWAGGARSWQPFRAIAAD